MKYNVSFAYTIVGTCQVEASSSEEAEQDLMARPSIPPGGEYLEDSFQITGVEPAQVGPHDPTPSEDGWLEQAYEDRSWEGEA